jgi:histidinol-phosphate phosphatase family protein
VKEALAHFARIFKYIFIATNQRGVGKGLMSEQDLLDLHAAMTADISKAGGRIDGIFFCTSLSNDDPDRKPNPGMALKARQQFPDIEFSKSIMIGNNISDMEFGRNAGMYTVFLKTTQPDLSLPQPSIDLDYNGLLNFAEAVNNARNLY